MQGSRNVFRAGLDSGVNWGKSGIRALAVLVGLVGVMLAFAAPASALPAICDEYPDLPVCSANTGGGGDGSGDDVGSATASGGPDLPVGSDTTGGGDSGPGTDSVGSAGTSGSPSSAGGTGSGGELPFTGYPLTTLLLLMLLLLALGLAIRAGVAIHDRLGGRGQEADLLPPPA